MHELKRPPSAIGRPLDMYYLTNRIIAILTLVVMVSRVSYHLFTGSPIWESILVGGAVVGGSDSFISFLFSPVTAQIVVFSLAIVLIRFRPQGLIGTKRRG